MTLLGQGKKDALRRGLSLWCSELRRETLPRYYFILGTVVGRLTFRFPAGFAAGFAVGLGARNIVVASFSNFAAASGPSWYSCFIDALYYAS